MLTPNMNYANLKDSYLFYNIDKKISAYSSMYSFKNIYKLGIGDVSLPLCSAVITALHGAVDEMADKKSFQGYVDECGVMFLRQTIAKHYEKRGVALSADEVFISSGASDELGNILDLFDKNSSVMVIEPAYPAYVDANIIDGRNIIHFESNEADGFAPYPDNNISADIVYICSPNNPTGAVFSRKKLKEWVNWANNNGSVIIFDAAYEAFIEDEDVPHSIFEIKGAKTCAIEICSLSKTAGFTGTRLGYTVIPEVLERKGMHLNAMWVRNRTTKSNGVSYIIQKGAAAVFTDEGQMQIKENINVYKNNARVIMKALDEIGLTYFGGKNAPYIWLKCPKGMKSWEFFDYLLNEIQVVGTPGVGFGENGEGYFRFTTFGDTEDTKIAAERLTHLLGKKNN